MVTGIILTGMIGRFLGTEEFGIWYLLSTFAALLFVIADWGYTSYVIREVSQHPSRAGELTGTVLILRLVAVGVLCGPAVLLSRIIGYETRVSQLILLIAIASLPSALISSFSWVFRARERMDLEAFLGCLMKVLALAAVVAWAYLSRSHGMASLLIAYGIAGTVGLALAAHLYTTLRLSPLSASWITARELVRQSFPLFTIAFLMALQPYIDANVLATYAHPSAVGWYGAAASLLGTLVAPAVILAGTFYPRLTQVASDAPKFTRLVHTALRPILFVGALGAVGTFLFADVAVNVVYRRDGYGPAVIVLQAFSPTLLLVSINMLLANVVLAAGGIGTLARVKFLAIATTVVLELMMVPSFESSVGNGGLGVMAALAAGEVVVMIGCLYVMPGGTLTREAVGQCLRAAAIGGMTLLATRPLLHLSPIVTIPFTVVFFTVLARVAGIVTAGDAGRIATFVRRRFARPAPATA